MEIKKILLNGIGVGILLFLLHLFFRYTYNSYAGEPFPADYDYLSKGFGSLIKGILFVFLRTLFERIKKSTPAY